MDRAKFFGESHRDGSDFLVDLLVLEDEDSGVNGWKWQKGVQCGGQLRGERRQGGIVTDGDHLDRGGVSRVRVCGDVYPASNVSRISYQDLYLARGEIFKVTESYLLKGVS